MMSRLWVWIWIWLPGLALCASIFGYWGVWLPLHSSGYDFTGPYEAAYALAHHARLQVYDVTMQRVFNNRVLRLPDGPSDFRWTPPSAALLIPLGLLPYAVARIVWWIMSLAALLASLWLLARSVATSAQRLGRSVSVWAAALLLFGAAACAQPITDSLRLGQSTTFLLLGFSMVVYGEVHRRPGLSGVGLAIAILDKLFPGILLIYFFWRGNYRLVLVTLAVLTALILLTLPVTGIAMYGAFVEALRTYSNQPNAGLVNLSLYHALIVLFGTLVQHGASEPTSGIIPALALLICVASFGAFLLAQGMPDIVRRRLSPQPDAQSDSRPITLPLFAVSWAVCSMLLVEPIVWIFYYVLLLVPLAWLLTIAITRAAAGNDRLQRWWLVGLVGYLIATLVFPLDPRIAAPMSAAYILGICAHPLGLALVWLAHAAYACRGSLAKRQSSMLLSVPLDG
jgi:hypothetical protein